MATLPLPLPGIQGTFALPVTDKHETMANVKASRLAFIHPAMVLTQIFKPISLTERQDTNNRLLILTSQQSVSISTLCLC